MLLGFLQFPSISFFSNLSGNGRFWWEIPACHHSSLSLHAKSAVFLQNWAFNTIKKLQTAALSFMVYFVILIVFTYIG